MATHQDPQARIGEVHGGYRLVGLAGSGGMGVVYEAVDEKLNRKVALKFLHTSGGTDGKAAFLREAKTCAALDHPNIGTVYTVGETTGGELFLAMAWYDGESLATRIHRGPMVVAEALCITAQVAEGMAHSHNAGIIHRDLKPSNILLTAKGVVKVIDFGIAKVGDESNRTPTGTVVGTPAYVSPERIQGKPADARSDIWALGVILFELLAGGTPFHGDNSYAMMYSILTKEPDLDRVPERLRSIVQKALTKDPEARYDSMSMLAGLLRGGAGGPVFPESAADAPTRKMRPVIQTGGPADYEDARQLADATGYRAGVPMEVSVVYADIVNSTAEHAEITRMADLLDTIGIIGGSPIWNDVLAGDSYCAAFETPAAAVHHALDLRDAVKYHDWRADGIRRSPKIRIGVARGTAEWRYDPRRKTSVPEGEVFAEAQRIQSATKPGEVRTTRAVAQSRMGSFYFHELGEVALPKNFGTRILFSAHRAEEKLSVQGGFVGPLDDEQDFRRGEAFRRFAYLWLALDQLPAGGWGRSTAVWMREIWRDAPGISINPLMDDEGGFETTILNLHLLSEIIGIGPALQGAGRQALTYIARRETPHGFGPFSLTAGLGYQVETATRHTALVAWLLGTAFKSGVRGNPIWRKMFRHAAWSILGGDVKAIKKEMAVDRHPVLLYLAIWHTVDQACDPDWTVFSSAEIDKMKDAWGKCEQFLREERALRQSYKSPTPGGLRTLDEDIYPMSLPYGEFVRMEGYSLLSSATLLDKRMPSDLKDRFRQAIELIATNYLNEFGAGQVRYTRDPLRPNLRGPRPYCIGSNVKSYPDLGVAGLLVRILRTPHVVEALWEKQPPEWMNRVRFLLTEDLIQWFDRYLICPKVFALTHSGMMASALAGDHKKLRGQTAAWAETLVAKMPSIEITLASLEDKVPSEKCIDQLVENVIAETKTAPGIQMAIDSASRLLLDKLRPGKYIKESRDEVVIAKIAERTLAVYKDQAFIEKYDQKWHGKADTNIVSLFTGLLKGRTSILDVGSGPGQYAQEFCRAGHDVHLLDGSREFLAKAQERLPTVPWDLCNVLSADDRAVFARARRFGAVWCSALLVHIPKTSIPDVLRWFSAILEDRGILFANVMVGNPRAVSRDGRYFNYFATAEEFGRMLSESGFRTEFTLTKTVVENTYGEPGLEITWANFYAVQGGIQRKVDIGTVTALLTSRAYEAAAGTFQQRGSEDQRNSFPQEQITSLRQYLTGEARTILDAGCGPGRFALEMVREGWIVEGIDISDRMVSAARRRLKEAGKEDRAGFRVGDMRFLPEEWSGKFDAILCVSALQHLADLPEEDGGGPLKQALTEFSRVLKPGGILRIDVRIGQDSGYDPDLRFIQAFPNDARILELLKPLQFIPVGKVIDRVLPLGLNTFRREIELRYREMWFQKAGAAA